MRDRAAARRPWVDVAGGVLVGGRSSRMGRDKAGLRLVDEGPTFATLAVEALAAVCAAVAWLDSRDDDDPGDADPGDADPGDDDPGNDEGDGRDSADEDVERSRASRADRSLQAGVAADCRDRLVSPLVSLVDPCSDRGPLSGLLALATAFANARVVVAVPVDTPGLGSEDLRRLVAAVDDDHPAAVFAAGAGPRPYAPLPVAFSPTLAGGLRARLGDDDRSVMAWLRSVGPVVVGADDIDLRQANTPTELAELVRSPPRRATQPRLRSRAVVQTGPERSSPPPTQETEGERRATEREGGTLDEVLVQQRLARRISVERVDAGEPGEPVWDAPTIDLAAEEEPLEIRVNGASVAVVMRTPGHDDELARGFLLTEDVVADPADIARIAHCEDVPDEEAEDNILDVRLRDGVPLDLDRLRRNLFQSSSCGVCGKATLAALATRRPALDDVAGPRVALSTVLDVGARLRRQQRVFERTGGLHAAALFDDAGELFVVREDVGRHNAVDKVLGHAFARGWLPGSTHGAADARRAVGLFVSGRLSFELVQKAALGGVPVLAGVSAPSSLAVRLALSQGLTLLGFVRGARANVYAGARRLR